MAREDGCACRSIQYTRAVGYGVYDRLKEQTAKGIRGNGVGAGPLEVLEVFELPLASGKVYRGSCVGWGMSNSIMYLNYVRNTDPFADPGGPLAVSQ